VAARFISSAAHTGNPTTSCAITIPTVLVGDLLVAYFTNGGATTAPTVTDDDGGTWTKKTSATVKGTLWWRRATSATSAKVVTAAGMTNSSSGTLFVIRGATPAGDPFHQYSEEENIAGNETHAGITTTIAGCYIGFCIANGASNGDSAGVATVSGATIGAFANSRTATSTGGVDSANDQWGVAQAAAGATGAVTWAQADLATSSALYAVTPLPEVSSWWRPASEPTRRGGLTAAVIASGLFWSGHTPVELTGPGTGLASTVQGNAPRVQTLLYPALQEPVPLDMAAPGEDVTVDKWFSPPSQPVRRTGIGVEQQPALAWSGHTPAEPGDGTGLASVVGGLAPRVTSFLYPSLQEPVSIVEAPAETVTLDKWFAPLSQPIRGRTTTGQQFLAFVPNPETLAWYVPVQQPQAGKPRQQQEALFWSGHAPLQVDDWRSPIEQPQRRTARQYQEFFWGYTTPASAEDVTLDKWFTPAGQPQFKPARQYQEYFWSAHTPAAVVETVTVDKWFAPLAQPQFRKHKTGEQQTTAFVVPWLSAPVLTWTGDTQDNTPDFDIEFDSSADEGAVITLEIATDSGFTSIVVTYNDTLDAGEVAANLVEIAASNLPNGTYYARAKVTDGGIVSAWSNTEEVTIGTLFTASYQQPPQFPVRRIGLNTGLQQHIAFVGEPPVVIPGTPGDGTGLASVIGGLAPRVTSFLYPALQEPVPVVAGETVTLDKWFATLAQPQFTTPRQYQEFFWTAQTLPDAPEPEPVVEETRTGAFWYDPDAPERHRAYKERRRKAEERLWETARETYRQLHGIAREAPEALPEAIQEEIKELVAPAVKARAAKRAQEAFPAPSNIDWAAFAAQADRIERLVFILEQIEAARLADEEEDEWLLMVG
jgi:hypothetical protein